MDFSVISTTLARTNLYFSLSAEPHLKALLALAKIIELKRSSDTTQRTALPEGFIFPLDAIVALSGGLEEEGASTLIRFVGKNEFFRVDCPTAVGTSLIIRPGVAIWIDQGIWMSFGSRFPGFMESMVEFTQGRNALSILNANCYSSHRYSRRIARLLLEARSVMPETDDWIPLSQAEIAGLMNTRRETIAAELLALSLGNIIETKRRKIRILDANKMITRSCGCFDKSVALADRQLSIAKRMFAGVPSNHPAPSMITNQRPS